MDLMYHYQRKSANGQVKLFIHRPKQSIFGSTMDGNFHEEKWAQQLQRIRVSTTDADTPDGNHFGSFLVLGGQGLLHNDCMHHTEGSVQLKRH